MSLVTTKFTKTVKKRKCIYGEEYSVLKKFKVPDKYKRVDINEPYAIIQQTPLEKVELRSNIQFDQNLKKNIKSTEIEEKKHMFNEKPTMRPVSHPAIVEKFYCDLSVCKQLVFICKICYCRDMCTSEKCYFE